jgi:hypothetical protein
VKTFAVGRHHLEFDNWYHGGLQVHRNESPGGDAIKVLVPVGVQVRDDEASEESGYWDHNVSLTLSESDALEFAVKLLETIIETRPGSPEDVAGALLETLKQKGW